MLWCFAHKVTIAQTYIESLGKQIFYKVLKFTKKIKKSIFNGGDGDEGEEN